MKAICKYTVQMVADTVSHSRGPACPSSRSWESYARNQSVSIRENSVRDIFNAEQLIKRNNLQPFPQHSLPTRGVLKGREKKIAMKIRLNQFSSQGTEAVHIIRTEHVVPFVFQQF